jgi:putative phosphoribosyl transferase
MTQQLVKIKSDGMHMEGMLELPERPLGIVLFAHGSGSGRHSPRNNEVANWLRAADMGTLLLDLLSAEEDLNYYTRFDINLLTQRLGRAVDWVSHYEGTRDLPLGLFGASTGAAAALQLAAERGAQVAAVVSRGGRPDMAGRHALDKVRAPTLLIVGGLDTDVLGLNQVAFTALHCEKRLEMIAGAGHLFEEPGTLRRAAELASDWFVHYFSEPREAPRRHRDWPAQPLDH